MSDFAGLGIWDEPAIRDGLSWYLAVAENRRPAKFRIAATLATQLDPATSGEEALWTEFDRLMPIFVARWQAIREGARLPATVDGPSLLELCRELAYGMLTHYLLSVELPRRPFSSRQIWRLQASFCLPSQLLFPSHRRGAVLPRHGRLRHDLLHLLQYAVRLLPKRRYQHRQGQRRGGGPAHTCNNGVDAAPRRLPQHQLGRRRGGDPPACHR